MTTEAGLAEEFKAKYGPYFTYQEFRCKCDLCQAEEDEGAWFRTPEFNSFMGFMIDLRESLAFPFVITSGYRCPAHNNSVSSTGFDGPHTIGAADVGVAYERAYALAKLAFSHGLGVGIAQKGAVSGRFIHIDNLGQRLWSY